MNHSITFINNKFKIVIPLDDKHFISIGFIKYDLVSDDLISNSIPIEVLEYLINNDICNVDKDSINVYRQYAPYPKNKYTDLVLTESVMLNAI